MSAKFTRQRVLDCFDRAGLRMQAWYTDERERFALTLAVAEEGK
ncbi:MAG TPA: L-histidine N(alpha)-methyltransferase [Chloroflexota bacterium]|nr:L-histidine N(alpha)-methyltransferase [Chloroflexota bacterium]